MACVRRFSRVASRLAEVAGAGGPLLVRPSSSPGPAALGCATWAHEPRGAGSRGVRVMAGALPAPSAVHGLGQATRPFATSLADAQGRVDEINDAFVEARDEIEYAQEDAETVYFNESAGEARKCVEKTLGLWGELLAELSESDKATLQRSMGMKIEQLKAELEQLNHLHDD